jgi:hypothetical protein
VLYSLPIQAQDYNILDESSPRPFSSLEKILSSRFFYLGDVPDQWPRVFHLNF